MTWAYFWSLLSISLHAMVPITLAAVGEVIGESAGLFNIGLEGILLLSAFTGTLGAKAGGPLVGLLAGVATGLAVGFIFGLICAFGKGNQLIAGVGLNLFALGFVAFGLQVLGSPGFHKVPDGSQLPPIRTPVGAFSPLIPLALALPFFVHWLLGRTRVGLRLKAVGENPEAADVAGIPVEWVQLWSTTAGAAPAGLAGAYMSVSWLGSVTKEISAGRGFIALATVVFSGLRPLLALAGGLLFGFFESLATWIQSLPGVKEVVPWQFIAMIPYVATLLVVAGVIGRVRFPKALGVPYRRE
ncbi:MAG: ABC transporter permease [Candidatus Bipolaricaulaceae bacterium]